MIQYLSQKQLKGKASGLSFQRQSSLRPEKHGSWDGGAGRAHLYCTQKAKRELAIGRSQKPSKPIPSDSSSSKAPPPKDSITSPNSTTKWRQNIPMHKPLGDILIQIVLHLTHVLRTAWSLDKLSGEKCSPSQEAEVHEASSVRSKPARVI